MRGKMTSLSVEDIRGRVIKDPFHARFEISFLFGNRKKGNEVNKR